MAGYLEAGCGGCPSTAVSFAEAQWKALPLRAFVVDLAADVNGSPCSVGEGCMTGGWGEVVCE